MQMINRLLSVLFLIGLTSVAFSLNLKARVKSVSSYFIIRSEWDDRCVAYINANLVLVRDCQMGQAVWEAVKGQTSNIAIKNYYTGKYLGFQPGVRLPQMLGSSSNTLAKWNFIPIHGHNRRWPGNRSYWHITYHVIKNIGTSLCLMVNGDTVSQLNCNPGKPEHLSFEEVKFNSAWQKSPERITEEKKTLAPKPIPTPINKPVISTKPASIPPVVNRKPAVKPNNKKPVISRKPARRPPVVNRKPAVKPNNKKPIISRKPARRPPVVNRKPAVKPKNKKPVISRRPARRPPVVNRKPTVTAIDSHPTGPIYRGNRRPCLRPE